MTFQQDGAVELARQRDGLIEGWVSRKNNFYAINKNKPQTTDVADDLFQEVWAECVPQLGLRRCAEVPSSQLRVSVLPIGAFLHGAWFWPTGSTLA